MAGVDGPLQGSPLRGVPAVKKRVHIYPSWEAYGQPPIVCLGNRHFFSDGEVGHRAQMEIRSRQVECRPKQRHARAQTGGIVSLSKADRTRRRDRRVCAKAGPSAALRTAAPSLTIGLWRGPGFGSDANTRYSTVAAVVQVPLVLPHTFSNSSQSRSSSAHRKTMAEVLHVVGGLVPERFGNLVLLVGDDCHIP